MQNNEYQKFCWEVTKLKNLSAKMDNSEIQRICEELAEIAPTYLIL